MSPFYARMPSVRTLAFPPVCERSVLETAFPLILDHRSSYSFNPRRSSFCAFYSFRVLRMNVPEDNGSNDSSPFVLVWHFSTSLLALHNVPPRQKPASLVPLSSCVFPPFGRALCWVLLPSFDGDFLSSCYLGHRFRGVVLFLLLTP